MTPLPTPEPLELDVRPALAAGTEPFPLIMDAQQRLKPGQALHLTAPFEPRPLYPVFQSAGFAVEPMQRETGEWLIRFLPATASGGDTRELDVRELEPPGPLQKGLEAAAALGRGETLVLHTRFRPVHLFEELDADGFDWESEESAPLHWITHIWRVSAHPGNHH